MQNMNNKSYSWTSAHERLLQRPQPKVTDLDFSLGHSRCRWPQENVLRPKLMELNAGDDDGAEESPCRACTVKDLCTVTNSKPVEDDDDHEEDLGAACLGNRRALAAAERKKCREQKRRIADEKNRLEQRRPALDCLKDLRFEMETLAKRLRVCLCQPEGESCVREDTLVAEGKRQERRLRELRRYVKQLERWEREYENAWPKDEKCPEMRKAFAYTLELLHRMRCEVYACERLDVEIKELMDQWRDELKWGKGPMTFVAQYFRAREKRHRLAEQEKHERNLQQKQKQKSMHGGKAPRTQDRLKSVASTDSDDELPVSSWEGRAVFDRRTPAVPTTLDLCDAEQPPVPNVSSDYWVPGEQDLGRLSVCCRPVMVSHGTQTDDTECSGRLMDIDAIRETSAINGQDKSRTLPLQTSVSYRPRLSAFNRRGISGTLRQESKTYGIDRSESSGTLHPEPSKMYSPGLSGMSRQKPSRTVRPASFGTIHQLPSEYLRQKTPGIFYPGPSGINRQGMNETLRSAQGSQQSIDTVQYLRNRRKISFMC